MFFKQFGGKVTQDLTRQYEQSENWYNGSFQNLEETSLSTSLFEMPRIIYKQLANQEGRIPKQPLPVMPFDQEAFLAPSDTSKFIWYGHSAILLRIAGKTLLIDPMLGPDTAPIAPFATKRFSENTLDLIDDFPAIDVILLTHDHYDHLDLASIQKLKTKTKRYLVAMGVKRHLVSWGIPAALITEFDWWQVQAIEDIQITFTPTRHFSGRGLTDRSKTLWGGWVFSTQNENIWFSGDGGYGQHFKEVGRRLGPFDFAFMECGQYNEDWRPVHLFPDEAVQAALDAGAKKAMPVHWAGFPLSYQHTWQEPPIVFVNAARDQHLAYALPALGQLFDIGTQLQEQWWDKYQ
ncbi:MAG: MBL fold metallo-hydrolase [Saprospiraceae bacterium]|nr:MBL fold metallo-hydrolase [Saprospiraceae bacterium]